MNRELDPSLFSPQKDEQENKRLERSHLGQAAMPVLAPVIAMEVKEMKQMMGLMQRKIQEMERKHSDLEGQMRETHQNHHVRLEKIIQAFQRLEGAYHNFHKDASERLAQLQSRVNERRVSESRIEELFDRQNLVFQNYEGRLTALQKLISDKEMQLMNYASALREARQDLSRMKR